MGEKKDKASSKKKKILKVGVALVVLYVVFVVSYALGESSKTEDSTPPSTQAAVTAKTLEVSSIDKYQLWDLTNQERMKAGLTQLKYNPKLNDSSAAKCNDMVTKNYWEHNDPSGLEPWHFITEAGIVYKAAGENQAYGFMTADATVQGWMNSEGHKENILKAQYTEVGFAVCKSENFQNEGPQLIIVQHFIG